MSQQSQIVSSPDINKMVQLLEAMNFSAISAQISEAAKRNASVLLLVGNTGSGKSTIFNWLNDAEFQILQKGINCELALKSTENKFQEMKGGLESVTAIPKCLYNAKHNHIVIDFPGFGDTHGWVNQFVIKLILNKILKIASLKVAFITAQPTGQFVERGASLFKEIKSLLQSGITQQDEIALILNQYCDEYPEDEIIQYVLEQLQELSQNAESQHEKLIINAASKKVTLIEMVNSQEKLRLSMCERAKEILWNKLKSIRPIQIKQFKLEHQDRIVNFCQNILENYFHQIQDFFGLVFNQIDEISIEGLSSLIQELSKLQQMKLVLNSQFVICQKACQILISKLHLKIQLPQVDARLHLIYELVKEEDTFASLFQRNEEQQKQMIQHLAQQITQQLNSKINEKNFEQEQNKLKTQEKREYIQAQETLQRQFEQSQEILSTITDKEEYNKRIQENISEFNNQSLVLQQQHDEKMEKMNKDFQNQMRQIEQERISQESQKGFFEFFKVWCCTLLGVVAGPAVGIGTYLGVQGVQTIKKENQKQ